MTAALALNTRANDTAAPAITVTPAQSAPAQILSNENFTGTARLTRLWHAEGDSRAAGGLVHFEPGARTHWHSHPLGQTLIVTAGTGRVQQWGQPIQEIRKGDTVRIPPGVKHWHGAGPDSAMSHIAVTEHLDGKTTDWLAPVTDAQFAPELSPPASHASHAHGVAVPSIKSAASTGQSAQPSRAQQLMGDIAPALANLTDDVLFGQVWARPELSRRDRSLATVSALVALNRPDQLRSHLALARQNGLSKEELVEVITHLAFYAGWPSGVSAALVAKDVFGEE
ncbi:carboxymuconolactone decarboxylase [Cephaloticoccus primus]|uniref:Carboxymuconolactone decarboxylase n=2 Tax=Cephaloticoccus primus TaxID=1548207 RepID=A0A139SIK5_9BACT|nr:carboxymuconolactone decarboxylase [Cephaloticoccus primus]